MNATSAPVRRRRVGFLTSHPVQYVAPLYARIARSEHLEPVALYLTDFSLRGGHDRQFGKAVTWDVDLLEGYEHHFVGRDYQTAEPYGFFNLRADDIRERLKALKLDALVLHGHNFRAMIEAFRAARSLSIPQLYKGETHLLLPRSALKSAVRKPIMTRFYARMDGFLAISQRNAEFYRSLGVPASKIFDYPYTVDNDRFFEASRLTQEERLDLLASFGLDPALPTVVFASKFMPRKHPADVLLACARLQQRGIASQLLFVGSGEQEAELRALAQQESALKVVFAGFQNQTQLPRILGASNIFVLPSENEPFGLIVNEAMCAGLPIVASTEIGCVPDLVHQDVNGRVFEARDVAGLADALEPLVRDASLRQAMSEASRQIIADWSFERNVRGLTQAIEHVVR